MRPNDHLELGLWGGTKVENIEVQLDYLHNAGVEALDLAGL